MPDKPNVTQSEIVSGLKRLGLPEGAVVLVHSSMKSFGHVEGGPEAAIDALLETVGLQGTVVVPTLSFSSFDEENPSFDVRSTPSDTGLITEAFRKRPEAVRSLHPFSSAAAIGPGAREIVSEHLDTPCALNTPYGKVYAWGGWVLFLGAPFTSNTLFHVAEEIVNPEYLIYRTFENVRITNAEGRSFRAAIRRYDCYQRGRHRFLGKMEPVFYDRGLIREARIGASRCRLMRAAENVETCARMLREHVGYILEESARLPSG
ncbi:MAG: AAC(3) family N-acetyltransferase [Armatimonadetes bacterium]|nr:AAC(3) family N-acetyltransferase [Armatimonadota bacterium]